MRLIYKGLEADTYTDDKFVYKIYPSKSIDKISNEAKWESFIKKAIIAGGITLLSILVIVVIGLFM